METRIIEVSQNHKNSIVFENPDDRISTKSVTNCVALVVFSDNSPEPNKASLCHLDIGSDTEEFCEWIKKQHPDVEKTVVCAIGGYYDAFNESSKSYCSLGIIDNVKKLLDEYTFVFSDSMTFFSRNDDVSIRDISIAGDGTITLDLCGILSDEKHRQTFQLKQIPILSSVHHYFPEEMKTKILFATQESLYERLWNKYNDNEQSLFNKSLLILNDFIHPDKVPNFVPDILSRILIQSDREKNQLSECLRLVEQIKLLRGKYLDGSLLLPLLFDSLEQTKMTNVIPNTPLNNRIKFIVEKLISIYVPDKKLELNSFRV